MSETIYQWALRTAKERRVDVLPKPVIQKKKHQHFVPIDYGYYKWGKDIHLEYQTMIKKAYAWGIANNKTKKQVSIQFKTSERNLREYIHNNKLPKLRT
jgi:hypothetical protein